MGWWPGSRRQDRERRQAELAAEVQREIERSHWLLDIERKAPPEAIAQGRDPTLDRRHLLDRFCGRCRHLEAMHRGLEPGKSDCRDCHDCAGFVYGSRPRHLR